MSQTTSIRLPPELRRALEREARAEGRGLNWILTRAAMDYLDRRSRASLEEDVHIQSLRAAQAEPESTDDWEQAADLQSWK